MKSLVKFLNERLDEDERTATLAFAAARSGTWDTNGILGELYASHDDPDTGHLIAQAQKGEADVLEHAARHDPARVLRQVAGLRIVMREHLEEGCSVCLDDVQGCPTLRALALAYFDHPGHDKAWRP